MVRLLLQTIPSLGLRQVFCDGSIDGVFFTGLTSEPQPPLSMSAKAMLRQQHP